MLLRTIILKSAGSSQVANPPSCPCVLHQAKSKQHSQNNNAQAWFWFVPTAPPVFTGWADCTMALCLI